MAFCPTVHYAWSESRGSFIVIMSAFVSPYKSWKLGKGSLSSFLAGPFDIMGFRVKNSIVVNILENVVKFLWILLAHNDIYISISETHTGFVLFQCIRSWCLPMCGGGHLRLSFCLLQWSPCHQTTQIVRMWGFIQKLHQQVRTRNAACQFIIIITMKSYMRYRNTQKKI